MKKSTDPVEQISVPEFLSDLLKAKAPSGHEYEVHNVLEKHLKLSADEYKKDALGNRFAVLNPQGNPTIMLAGHMDELGFIVRYIDDDGYISFDTLGSHDASIISGRHVKILSRKGIIHGITGKKAIHLMDSSERKKVPEIEDIWIDIGANSREETAKLVDIGDSIVYDHDYSLLMNNRIASRALDNRSGCYVVSEVLRRVAQASKSQLKAKLVSVATVQEEIGVRGAIPSAYNVNPHIAIAVDVSHATDYPDSSHKKTGKFELGAGPILGRGPNINPLVFERLESLAIQHKIPYQIEAESGPTSTDARALQIARNGAATGLVSIPLRYMHTPTETADLMDIENTVNLLVYFVLSIQSNETMEW